MRYVRNQMLTPHQAKELVHMGFILEIVRFMCREWDEYRVYVR